MKWYKNRTFYDLALFWARCLLQRWKIYTVTIEYFNQKEMTKP